MGDDVERELLMAVSFFGGKGRKMSGTKSRSMPIAPSSEGAEMEI